MMLISNMLMLTPYATLGYVFKVEVYAIIMEALFSELNRGNSITENLKHVDRAKPKSPPRKKASAKRGRRKSRRGKRKPAGVCEAPAAVIEPASEFRLVDDHHWIVQGKTGDELLIDTPKMRHAIVIRDCRCSTIRVSQKVTNLLAVGCTDLNLIVDSMLATLDVSKSQNIKVQVLGRVPTINLDTVTNVVVYNSEGNTDADFVTARIASCTVNQQKGEDWVEMMLPEQFISKIDAASEKVKTTVNDLFC